MELVVLNNEAASICVPCGGKCCKTCPGQTTPEDFGAPGAEFEVRLTAALRSGIWAVDWWDQDGYDDLEGVTEDTYFVRPAVKVNPSLVHGLWSGECGLLTDKGCALKFEQRPHACRTLVPIEGNCTNDDSNGKKQHAESWVPYQETLARVVRSIDTEAFEERVLDEQPYNTYNPF